jgi:hypothetical protein
LLSVFAVPAIASDCIECHTDILKQFSGSSHHIQGPDLSGKHCYSCHWEATSEGQINEQYHKRPAAKSAKKPGKIIDLVVWDKGLRPTLYKSGSTATSFNPSSIGSSTERSEIAKITRHCLGCHSDGNNNVRPFIGDNNSPIMYAWDGQSVASRYLQKGVTTWGKYSSLKGNGKMRITKAFSGHGNATSTKGGWSPLTGYDEKIPVTWGGSTAKNVECFDCHNSHGSSIPGVTSSYKAYGGSFSGAILKDTAIGKSGYKTAYTPSSNLDKDSKNPYNFGAGLCFDCHETAKTGTTPWGYNSTFGASKPIMGYKDSPHFGPGNKGSTARYTNRESRTDVVSSHLKAGSFLNYSAEGRINGLCTPCHDPHGVSRTLGDKMRYAVPLLKGTWLTSPYREDGPPTNLAGKGDFAKRDASGNRGEAWEKGDFSLTNREANANFGIGGAGTPREPMAGMKYFIDKNTFGPNGRILEDVDTFGGLCLKCHSKEKSGGKAKSDLIHRSVKGWGNNKEHSFPCSKCHQPHNSGLPRLMQTNCFVSGPAGLRENSGISWTPDKKGEVVTNIAKESKQPTSTSKSKKSGKGEVVGCHVRQFGGSSAAMPGKQGDGQWSEKTKW